ncbi:MAG: HAMP domain-containing sensor histidine kinase [Pseudohongiella sp.]|nr:HAMP domain-containing sensor histidine kinase [Pseudohongiella sp.]
MIRQLSLRARVMLAIVLLVTVISTLFVGVIWEIKVRLEAVAFGHMVSDQLTLIMESPGGPAQFDDSLLSDWHLYYGPGLEALPAQFASLSEGSHHSVRVSDRYFQVEVRYSAAGPVVLSQDISEWEQQEHWLLRLLAAGVLLVLVVAIFAGYWASLAVLSPLQALTKKLSAIRPDQRGVRVASGPYGNEVARIAHAFDLYLERLDRFVEREKYFAVAASHELRTPLSVVMGAVEVLESQASGQSVSFQRTLQRISRACQDMLGFIEVSLLLSREEARPVQIAQRTQLSRVINRLAEDHDAQLKVHNIELHQQLQTELWLDQSASIVQMVLSNLLRNAIEHTTDGQISIRLQGSCLSIEDTGEGIAADQLARVFERSYSTKHQGTGMGLDLVRRLCERFNWKINLSSEPGQGTRVEIDFGVQPGSTD